MRKLLFLFVVLPFFSLAQEKIDLIQSGPMLGYAELTECLVWVQLKSPTKNIVLEYWPQGEEENRHTTAPQTAEANLANVLKFVVSGLQPGRTYEYRFLAEEGELLNPHQNLFSTQELWSWRYDPPEFSFALGSCSYINEPEVDRPGKPYGGDYHIFNAIANKQPDMMLWLGDNIYLREVDFFSRAGIFHRYTHTRSIPEMQPLLSTCNHYAIWDDHDYGPNNSDFSYTHKDWTLEAFKLFWGNNGYGFHNQSGITGFFRYNDMDFFLLDNRYYRTPQWDGKEREILGKAQIEWLIAALLNSRAPFKFVAIGGQVLNTAEMYENHAVFAQEKEYLLQRMAEEKIEGVVFLTGDRHHTELSKVEKNGITFYDLTVSPLTSRPSTVADDEVNENRVAGTFVSQRNFGLIEVRGPRKERTLTIRILDANGELIWKQQIEAPKKY